VLLVSALVAIPIRLIRIRLLQEWEGAMSSIRMAALAASVLLPVFGGRGS